MNNRSFAGIGSRETPSHLIPEIERLSKNLIEKGFCLRSGGADGSDLFWESAYDKFSGQKEIFLPWKEFNKNKSELYQIKPEAEYIASVHHPKWKSLSEKSKKFHSRNVYQVLGYDLDCASEFVICWTVDGKPSGGTAQAMRIAEHYKIPIFNLYNKDVSNHIDSFLELNYNL